MKDKNLLRTPKGEWGEGFINFTSNDYLGLSRHPEVIIAGIEAAEKYGAGAGASRIAGGNHPLFGEFAEKIAAYKGYEAATVFGSGYLANLGVITALEPEVVYADKLVHASIIDAIKLSGAKLVRFKHNDVADLKKCLEKDVILSASEGSFACAQNDDKRRRLIITEEIFSMDGDFAPVDELKEIADKNNCTLIVDGAHSIYQKSKLKAHIYIGTMSKALGSYGGYVCGSRALIRYLETKARSLIYSTGLPPFAVGAAIKALEIAGRDELYLKVLKNTEYLKSSLPRFARNDGTSSIVPIILGSEEKALAAEKLLKDNKILVSAMRPPTVPKGTARLRISVTAAHTKSEIDLLADWLKTLNMCHPAT